MVEFDKLCIMQQSLKNIFFAIILQTSNSEYSPRISSHTSNLVPPVSFNYQNVHQWGDRFPKCKGKYQSPIDINLSKSTVIRKPLKLEFSGYHAKPESMKLITNGHGVKLTAKWEHSSPFLNYERSSYIFDSVHFHWGENNQEGSEHTIENIRFPLEMHLVHYNKKYNDLDEAVKHKDGFLVIGIVFEIRHTAESHFSPLAESLSLLKGANDSVEVKPFRLTYFNLKPMTGYIIYAGSLTTPPCTDNVIWLLSTQILSINNTEISFFRNDLLAYGDTFNFRPVKRFRKRKTYYYPKY